MALATLSIDIVAQIAKLQEGMDKAGRIAEKNAAQIERSFNKLKAVGAAVGVALAGAFSAGAMVQFVKANVDALDALNDLKDATGASIENLSALEDIARRNGSTLDDVSGVLVKFNGALKEADGKNGVSQALKAIGLDAAELRKLDPAEALRKTAAALAGFADDGNKARITQELFGKSIRDAAPMLKDLAEAGALNAKVTTQQAEDAERFNKALFEFDTNVNNVSRSIISTFLPALNEMLRTSKLANQEFGNGFKAFEKLGFGAIGGNNLDGLNAAKSSVAELGGILQNLRDQASRGGLTGVQQAFQSQTLAKLEDEKRKVSYYEKVLGLDGSAGAGRGGSGGSLASVGELPSPTKPVKVAALEKLVQDQPAIPQALKDALQAIKDTDLEKVRALREQLAELISLKASGQGGPGIDEAMASLEEKILAFTPAQQAANAEVERFNALLAATPTATTEAMQADMVLLAKAYESGRISVEQFTEAVQTRLGTLPEELKPVAVEVSEFSRQFAANMQNAFGDTILSTLKGDFDNIGQMWGDLLLKMASQAIAADIGNAIFGKSAGGGGGSDLLGTFLSLFAADGAVLSGGVPVRAFAQGGVVGSPTLFGMRDGLGLMGEAGPEAVMPLKRGADGKLGVASSGGGGGVTIINQVAAGVQRNELMAALQMSSQATESRIVGLLRKKGVL